MRLAVLPEPIPDLKSIISVFGAEAKDKLANASASGEQEDQLRAPLEKLFPDPIEPAKRIMAIGAA
jgi:hypothetical protein